MKGLEEFSKTVSVIESGIAKQWHTCAQVFVAKDGDVLADFGVGEFFEGRKVTTSTIMPWMSCTKMVTAVAFAILVERNKVAFTDLVSSVIPEFACEGKEKISFEQLLNHTCGIRFLSMKWDEISWEESIAAICAMPVEENWQIGKDGGYHIGTSWFILGEAIQRLSGKKLEDFVNEEIYSPLEMKDCWLAMPDQIYNDLDKMARFYRTDLQPIRLAVEKYGQVINKCRPGASGRGPIRELAKFMEALRQGGMAKNGRIISERTVKELTTPSRIGVFDKTFMKRIDWGLGFMIDSKKYQSRYMYSFGVGCSETTFGHNGNQSSAAYVDPNNELTVCFVFNGMPGEPIHQERLAEMNQAIYEDLGLI